MDVLLKKSKIDPLRPALPLQLRGKTITILKTY